MKESLNLRAPDPAAIRFGDDESRAAYIRARDAALARQVVRYAVAPLGPLRLFDVTLAPGAEVTIDHFAHEPYPRDALERMIRTGRVLDRTHGGAQ